MCHSPDRWGFFTCDQNSKSGTTNRRNNSTEVQVTCKNKFGGRTLGTDSSRWGAALVRPPNPQLPLRQKRLLQPQKHPKADKQKESNQGASLLAAHEAPARHQRVAADPHLMPLGILSVPKVAGERRSRRIISQRTIGRVGKTDLYSIPHHSMESQFNRFLSFFLLDRAWLIRVEMLVFSLVHVSRRRTHSTCQHCTLQASQVFSEGVVDSMM